MVEFDTETDGQVALRGELTFKTVMEVIQRGCEQVSSGSPTVVDLAGLSRCDSAGLALLVEWSRVARACNTELRIVGASDQLLGLALTSNLQFLFHSDA